MQVENEILFYFFSLDQGWATSLVGGPNFMKKIPSRAIAVLKMFALK